MIKIKRVYEPPEVEDGFRVLVDRLWPRGFSRAEAAIDLWIKEIAPSAELRKWFAHDPVRWEEFCIRYAAELERKSEEVALLKEKSEAGVVTLLYSAADLRHNNAVALRQFLETRWRREPVKWNPPAEQA